MKWAVRDNIISPIIVNLITALILFLFLVTFKDSVYRAIKAEEPVELYPLYCVAEPYTNEKGLLDSDLFIINLTGDEVTELDLSTFLKVASPQEEGVQTRKPDIELKWKKKLRRGRITKIVEDKGFNNGKGRVEISQPNQNGEPWGIRVRTILPRAILKFVVSTDFPKPGVTRPGKRDVPFDIDYPGEHASE